MRKIIIWRGFQVYANNVPMPMPGVYRFTNLIYGKVYIGMSKTSIEKRCGQHPSISIKKLADDIYDLGKRSFLCEPLFYITPELRDRWFNIQNFLYEIEANHIKINDSIVNGYNTVESSAGGSGSLGDSWAAKNLTARRTRSEREKITGSKKGWKHTDDTKKLMQQARQHQEITPAMLSALDAGRLNMTAEQHKSRMSKAWETRRKNSGSSGISKSGLENLKKPKSPETIERMRQAAVIREAAKRIKPVRKRIRELV